MEDMIPAIIAVAVYTSPAVVALIWSRLTSVKQVRRTMRWVAIIVVLSMIMLFAIEFVLKALCNGDSLKGFTHCLVIPDYVASLYLGFFLIVIYAVAAALLAAFSFCAYKEFCSSRQAHDEQ